MNDMEKASQIGIPAYNAEQEEKRKLLDFLLSHYNDGRRKNLFCVAVNLLTIKEIENILQTVKSDKDFQSMGKKEQASVIAKLLQDIAAPKGIESIDEFRGRLSYADAGNAARYERAQFMKYFSDHK